MKIAIYTIALNEEKNVPGFMQSCVGADMVVIGDTGSTDGTAQAVQAYGGFVVNLYVSPWRFDVPRNSLLSLLPPDVDICISLDLDERLPADWRKMLVENWKEGHTRVKFRYVHGFRPDGTPGTIGMKYFIHSRHNYVWRHAVHEDLYYTGPGEESILRLPQLVVSHHQDVAKDRSSYLRLLEIECLSPTATNRHFFWLAREYVILGRWNDAITACHRFLEQPKIWIAEKAAAYRYLAKAIANQGDADKALGMHYKAIECMPGDRDCWLDLAWYYHAKHRWPQAYGAVMQCVSITRRPEHYLATDDAWGYKPWELASLCATKMGMPQTAKEHLQMAIRIAPYVKHLQDVAARLGLNKNV